MQVTKRNTTALAAAALAPLLLAACSAQGGANESGNRLYLFFDMSASIDGEHRRIWSNTALRLAEGLKGGWGGAIYAIHDQTMAAAPLFEAEIPERDPDASYDAATLQRAALNRARNGATAAIRRALETSGGAARTDVFSAIDRIRPDARGRRTVAIFFCDMLNSTQDLNMEVPGAITRATAAAHITRLAQRHHWRRDQLPKVDVYCVLNSVASGNRGPAVDRLTQEDFYQALFGALGARLARYDTTLGSDGIVPVKGAEYVAQAR